MTASPVFSVALVSAAALAYEVLLTRLFSIVQWHHYAFMIISLALLGYGASGTFLFLTQKTLLAHFRFSFIVNLALFGISALVCFQIAQSIPFNPEEILFSTSQWRHLAIIYFVLSLPFFFAANAIGLSLVQFRASLARIYAADLIGAGLGALSIILLLFHVFPLQALQILAILGVVAGLVAAWECRLSSRGVWALLTCLALSLAIVPDTWTSLVISPYKDLSQTLRMTGSRIIDRHSSPLGLIEVVENTLIPLRHAPGLSLNADREPPAQLGLFIDGNGPSAITNLSSETDSPVYLGQLTSALPYYLQTPDDVLILGAGGGAMVLQALHLGAQRVTAVELDPQVVNLVRKEYADFAGHLYERDGVDVSVGEARGFLARNARRYDIVQLPVLDSYSASATGLQALGEDYLYTVEAFTEYLEHLSTGGLLAVNRWIRMPPRDTLKVFATAVQALEQLGLEQADRRLVLVRGWQTSTLLVKNGMFTKTEIIAIRDFCRRHSFDISYVPDMSPQEANRFNILPEPYFYQGARALLGNQREQFLKDYKFNLNPATDNQPFFFRFFRWEALPEIMQRYGEGGVPLIDTGYLVLVATLIQAVTASTILILVPLLIIRCGGKPQRLPIHRGRVLVYFAALGAGFLFIEIAFIQKLTLFLHHPLYSVAVSLTAFLIFAGLGSAHAYRSTKQGAGIIVPVAVVVLLCGAYPLVLPAIFSHLAGVSDTVHILVSILIIAPLAFCMGMPFPIGLARLAQHAPTLIPWAWGINGCASVISTVLATLVAIHYGFIAVIAIAALFYVIAALNFPKATKAQA